jgi:hypothetical protein
MRRRSPDRNCLFLYQKRSRWLLFCCRQFDEARLVGAAPSPRCRYMPSCRQKPESRFLNRPFALSLSKGERHPTCRLRRRLKSFDAAPAPQAAYFSLLVQREVGKRKHAPEPPKAPALLAPAGREPNSPAAGKRRSGSNTGSRLPPAGAAMLGGGYGSELRKATPTSRRVGTLCVPTIS